MAYAISAQVASEFKDITIGASTPVTSTEVDRFIAESDQEIDSIIAIRYSTPIDETENPLSFLIVRQLSIWLTAYRVGKILQVKSVVEEVSQEGGQISLRQRAMDMLDKIVKGEMTLPDADLAVSGGIVSDYNSNNSVEPLFDAEKDQF